MSVPCLQPFSQLMQRRPQRGQPPHQGTAVLQATGRLWQHLAAGSSHRPNVQVLGYLENPHHTHTVPDVNLFNLAEHLMHYTLPLRFYLVDTETD